MLLWGQEQTAGELLAEVVPWVSVELDHFLAKQEILLEMAGQQ